MVLKWFRAEGELLVEEARAIEVAYRAGELIIMAPCLLRLEVVNVAGRRWRLDEAELLDLSREVDALRFQYIEPELDLVARWTARGLTSYDASYVALAEEQSVRLITDDHLILSTAAAIAFPLAGSDG